MSAGRTASGLHVSPAHKRFQSPKTCVTTHTFHTLLQTTECLAAPTRADSAESLREHRSRTWGLFAFPCVVSVRVSAALAQDRLGLGLRPRRRGGGAALAPADGRKAATVADEFADFLSDVRRGVVRGVRATSR